MFPKALGRSDIAHVAPSVVPLLFFLMYITKSIINEKKLESVKKKIIVYSSIPIIIIMLFTVISPISKLITLAQHQIKYVKTQHGLVSFKSNEDAESFKMVMDYIQKNTTKDDYIFVTPWDAPAVYALTDRKNPSYYDSLNDLIVRPSTEKQQKLCQDIASHNTKVIIHNPDWGYDNKPEQQFRVACGILQDFIVNNYELVQQYGVYSIYIPKN